MAEKMFKARVKAGKYGPGGIHPLGSIVDVTQAELDAFSDKLELIAEPAEPTAGAAKLAEELNVDLSAVEGTGKDGRITAGDVRKAAQED